MVIQKEDVGEPEGVTDIDSTTDHGWLGKMLLALSLAGGPIILFVLRKFGRWGGPVVAAGCGTLFVRDLTMVTSGVPNRLRPLPRLLLLAEMATSATATMAGLWTWVVEPIRDGEPDDNRSGDGRGARLATGASVVTLALHSVRFAIYLSPSQGRVSSS
jgi:hypothetical protein